ncbi:hypothetical protein RBH29_11910, partial [Herbivorax sp. ANBcel31]|uniref:hypothetical protein n=1 Tax=Herbivorax sp. ANBcel31 TaxID=3069754 RepID=UPI0027ADC24D
YWGDPNDPLSLNLYTYCHNEPIMYFDPTGHSREYKLQLRSAAKQHNASLIDWDDDSKMATISIGDVSKNYYVRSDGKVYAYGGSQVGVLDENNRIMVNESEFYSDFAISPNIITTSLSNPNFLEIEHQNNIFYGGAQSWFERDSQRFGGCGPAAAANVLAYMAVNDSELAGLYDYDTNNINSVDFASYMETLYNYVTPFELYKAEEREDRKKFIPPSFGIGIGDFIKGVEEFAEDRNINLKANWSDEKGTFNNVVAYIREGLEKDRPVALINVFNPDLKEIEYIDAYGDKRTSDFDRHWVVITSMAEDKNTGDIEITASTWGGIVTLSLNDVYDGAQSNFLNNFSRPGVIYFEVE